MQPVTKISLAELRRLSVPLNGIVKANVDVERQILIVGMSLHVDGERGMLEDGSKQANIWGINLHVEQYGTDDFVEFDSMINLRPGQGNRSRGVDDATIRARIHQIVNEKVYVD